VPWLLCVPRQGMLVAAIEHADESSALTTDSEGAFVRYKHLNPTEKKDFGLQHVRRSGQVSGPPLASS
jgi:hypothetical protein